MSHNRRNGVDQITGASSNSRYSNTGSSSPFTSNWSQNESHGLNHFNDRQNWTPQCTRFPPPPPPPLTPAPTRPTSPLPMSTRDVKSALLDQNFLSENSHLLENILKNVDAILPTRKLTIEARADEKWTGQTSERRSREGGCEVRQLCRGGMYRGGTSTDRESCEREEFLKQREVLRWKEEQDRIRREWEKQQIGEEAWERKEMRRTEEEAGKSDQVKALEEEMRRFKEEQLKKLDDALGRTGDTLGGEVAGRKGKKRGRSSDSSSSSSSTSRSRSRSRSSRGNRSRSRRRSRNGSWSRLKADDSSNSTIDPRFNSGQSKSSGIASERENSIVEEKEKDSKRKNDFELQCRSTASQRMTSNSFQVGKEKKAMEVKERVAQMQELSKRKYQERKDSRQYWVEVEKLQNRTGQMAKASSPTVAAQSNLYVGGGRGNWSMNGGNRNNVGGGHGNWSMNDANRNNPGMGPSWTTSNGGTYHQAY